MATVRFSFSSSIQRCGYNESAGGRGGTVARPHSYHMPTGHSAHTRNSNMARAICLPLTSGGSFLKKESGCKRKPNTRHRGPFTTHAFDPFYEAFTKPIALEDGEEMCEILRKRPLGSPRTGCTVGHLSLLHVLLPLVLLLLPQKWYSLAPHSVDRH